MKCGDFEARLQQLLDARLPLDGDELLTRHAAECEVCRQDLVAFGTLVGEIVGRPRPLPAADLASRVIADLSAPQVERSVPKRTAWIAFAVAAAVLIAAFPMWRWVSDRADENGATVAIAPEASDPATSAAEPVASQPEELQPADPPIGDLVREVGDRYLDLAQETQASYAELALLLPGVRAPEPREDRAAKENVAVTEVAGSRGWVNDMTEGLKPVANSTMGAFSFLLEALPTEVPAEKL